MDDQPTRTTTDATADMFDLVEADLLRILRSRARRGELRPPRPGRPRDRRPARQPAARIRDRQLAAVPGRANPVLCRDHDYESLHGCG